MRTAGNLFGTTRISGGVSASLPGQNGQSTEDLCRGSCGNSAAPIGCSLSTITQRLVVGSFRSCGTLPLPQHLGRLLGRRRVDVDSGPPLEAGVLRQPRRDLEGPVIVLLHPFP